eukprot:CFRG1273T1
MAKPQKGPEQRKIERALRCFHRDSETHNNSLASKSRKITYSPDTRNQSSAGRLVLLALLGILLFFITAFFPSATVKKIFLGTFLPLLGVVVSLETTRTMERSTPGLFACNHVSALDSIAWQAVEPATVLMQNRAGKPPTRTSIERILKYISKDHSVCIFPESKRVSTGLQVLPFDEVGFGYEHPTYPVALSVTRPAWVGISIDVTSSSDLVNRLWALYSPYTVFSFKILEHVGVGSTTSSQQACDAQDKIARELSINALKVSEEALKSVYSLSSPSLRSTILPASFPTPSESTSHSSLEEPDLDSELLAMVAAVQMVFPQYPRSVILTDLIKTRHVDLTIENIISGAVVNPIAVSTTLSKSNSRTHNTGSGTATCTLSSRSQPERTIQYDLLEAHLMGQDNSLSNLNVHWTGNDGLNERKIELIKSSRERYQSRNSIM